MKNKLTLIAHDLRQLAIWHDPSDNVKDLEKRVLDYADMLKATARQIKPNEHRNLTDKPCPICEVVPNANHEVGCPSYGL